MYVTDELCFRSATWRATPWNWDSPPATSVTSLSLPDNARCLHSTLMGIFPRFLATAVQAMFLWSYLLRRSRLQNSSVSLRWWGRVLDEERLFVDFRISEQVFCFSSQIKKVIRWKRRLKRSILHSGNIERTFFSKQRFLKLR